MLSVAFDREVVDFGTVCVDPKRPVECSLRVQSNTGVPLSLVMDVDNRRDHLGTLFKVRQRSVFLPPWREVVVCLSALPAAVGTVAAEDCVLLVGVGSAAHVKASGGGGWMIEDHRV